LYALHHISSRITSQELAERDIALGAAGVSMFTPSTSTSNGDAAAEVVTWLPDVAADLQSVTHTHESPGSQAQRAPQDDSRPALPGVLPLTEATRTAARVGRASSKLG
jgi:hypothetical protein